VNGRSDTILPLNFSRSKPFLHNGSGAQWFDFAVAYKSHSSSRMRCPVRTCRNSRPTPALARAELKLWRKTVEGFGRVGASLRRAPDNRAVHTRAFRMIAANSALSPCRPPVSRAAKEGNKGALPTPGRFNSCFSRSGWSGIWIAFFFFRLVFCGVNVTKLFSRSIAAHCISETSPSLAPVFRSLTFRLQFVFRVRAKTRISGE
jgi:hypothetical protein